MSNSPEQFEGVTCPACGLLCDDITIQRKNDQSLSVSPRGCAKSIAFFERPQNHKVSPTIDGKSCTLEEAADKIAKTLALSRHPLITGLGTDVQGMRALMPVADLAGATIDHMNSYSSMRNTHVVQNSGWQVTTLTEVRNRVDLFVAVGTDIVSYNPRFFERMIWNKETLFDQDTSTREVVYLGGQHLNTAPGVSPNGKPPTVLPCDVSELPAVTAALRALVSGKRLAVDNVGGICVEDLQALADKLKSAKYSVIAWVSSSLDFDHAELTIQNITETVVKLNSTTRASGLPLGGSEGDYSVNQTSTWTVGYPMRSSFKRGIPEYDPHLLETDRLIAEQEIDSLLWISTFGPEKTAPETSLPLMVIAHPESSAASKAAVFIPVATPGIDHGGTLFRIDSSVSLPIQQLRDRVLPTLAEVLVMIENKVREYNESEVIAC